MDQNRRNGASQASTSRSGWGFSRYRRRCASTVDSTKPASRSTRRCFDTVGCGIPSRRSISPTDCWDDTRRLNIARRFGSAMISNTDSMLLIYATAYIRVKEYFKLSFGEGMRPLMRLGGCDSERCALRLLQRGRRRNCPYPQGDTKNFKIREQHVSKKLGNWFNQWESGWIWL